MTRDDVLGIVWSLTLIALAYLGLGMGKPAGEG